MKNRIRGEKFAKILTERETLSTVNVSLLKMSSISHLTVGTAVVSKIFLKDPDGLKRKIHRQEVRRRKAEEDLVVVRAARIILEHKILPYVKIRELFLIHMKIFSVDTTRIPRPEMDSTVGRGHKKILNRVIAHLFTSLLTVKRIGHVMQLVPVREKLFDFVDEE